MNNPPFLNNVASVAAYAPGSAGALLSAGPVEMFLQTGSRTMLSYMFKPISDQFHHMFNER